MTMTLEHSQTPFRISPIEEILEEARSGRMFILVDDEERENEGDLVIPAQMASSAAINFMAMHGRGLICLALSKERVDQLGLPLMSRRNGTLHQTAFTVSIEAREGVTTGISAADRARTVAVATDPACGSAHLVSPGHVFPLVARDGGVLVRAGHTEAAVDVSRLAGLNAAGVICEIMNDDGTMARLPQLMRFAQTHDLKIATIKDLIAYRRRTEKLVQCVTSDSILSRFGGPFQLKVYASRIDASESIALVRGDVSGSAPVLVRMHPYLPSVDVLGEECPRAGQLEQAMRIIAEAGRGVLVLLKEWRDLADHYGDAPARAGAEQALRDYGIGAQVLNDLGVQNMILLTNSHPVPNALEGYGLNIVDFQPIPTQEAQPAAIQGIAPVKRMPHPMNA
jgi:3,4-dihydroxy 2-butanone 4-phosphate synthase/GTP cyclohydrolase II